MSGKGHAVAPLAGASKRAGDGPAEGDGGRQGDGEIDQGRDPDSAVEAAPGQQHIGDGEGADGRTQGVDVVELPGGGADVARAAGQLGDEDRQRRAHGAGGNEEDQEGQADDHGQRLVEEQRAGAIDDVEAEKAEQGDQALDHGKDHQAVLWPAIGHPTAGQRADAEAQHEDGDDGADRVEIDAVPAKQGALPGNLIAQRGKARCEEQGAGQDDGLSGRRRRLRGWHWPGSSWARRGLLPMGVTGGALSSRCRSPGACGCNLGRICCRSERRCDIALGA